MTLTPFELAETAAHSILAKKGAQVQTLDLRQVSSVVDYFVIASADSEPQMKAIVEQILDDLGVKGTRPWHVEGTQGWRWVLLDYVDVAVHIFRADVRRFYGLERLWGDVPVTQYEVDPNTGEVNVVSASFPHAAGVNEGQ